jgi:uncharacterized protein (DUF433 family)
MMNARKRVELGEYVVSNPEICGGQLTFKGTRMLVKDVLEMVSRGHEWRHISEECYGRVSRAAIAEAVALAREALIEKAEKKT